MRVSYVYGNPPLWDMPIGSVGQMTGGNLWFWDGFNADPNDGTGPPPDILISFNGAFTVTVVPEPGTSVAFIMGTLSLMRRRSSRA